jgi:hypothetical protein
MYFAVVLCLLLIFPSASVVWAGMNGHHENITIIFLVGRWWSFWAVGVRLFIAGVRQVIQPRFTADEIFGVRDSASFPLVREIGFGNLSMGLLGVCSIIRTDWIVPAAIVGGLYYGLAGLGHIPQKNKNAKEFTAMISDLFVALLLAAFLIA